MIKSRLEIQKGINVLLNIEDPSNFDKVIKTMEYYGIDEDNAREYFIFIPIAFCRLMLPNIKFPEFYLEQDFLGNRIRKKFKNNPLYLEIESVTNAFFETISNSDDILKIASLSSEFNVVNKLLLNGGNMEDIQLTEMIIIK